MKAKNLTTIQEILKEDVAAFQASTAVEFATLGAASFYAKDLPKAAEFYQRALELSPTNQVYSKNLKVIKSRL